MAINKNIVFLQVLLVAFFSLMIQSREITTEQQALLDQLPADQKDSILQKMNQANQLQDELEEVFETESTLIKRPERNEEDSKYEKCQVCIFGYDFFQYSPSTFIQTSSSPVPSDYVLGPGDKVEVNYFGSNIQTVESFIARNGEIFLPLIGPVNLAGLKFEEARKFLNEKVKNQLIGTEISINLAELRSISVYVLGEAYKPGLYTMSGLSSISNALFVSGGVNEQGSLRNIQLKRNGEIIGTYDFYDFLLKGQINKNLRLQDGDIIFIPFIKNKVRIGGAFKRPYIYEFLEGETIYDAVQLAGGYSSDVPPNARLELSRIEEDKFERSLKYYDISSNDLKLNLVNEDSINISSSPKVVSRSVELTGEFNRPGVYSFEPGETILDVINRAGGLTTESYDEGAVFLRKSVAISQKKGFERSADELEQTIVNIITLGVINLENEAALAPLSRLITRLRDAKPLGRMVVDVNPLTLKTDPIKNIRLEDGDKLYIPTRPSSVSVIGEVLNSSTQSYDPSLGVFDYLNLAGGLAQSADDKRIFVIFPNGQSRIAKKTFFSSRNDVLPGSTIVVSRESRPLDGVNLAQIVTPILADLATSAAAIAAISD